MQQHVAPHLRDASPAEIKEAYSRMARNAFGRFEETVRLPATIDTARIQYACDDGTHLRIRLPKRVSRPRPVMPSGRFGYAPASQFDRFFF